jgi:hypothetical protein
MQFNLNAGMQKQSYFVLALFSALVLFVKQMDGFSSASNSKTKTHSKLKTGKFRACTIIVQFDDGSEQSKNVINYGSYVLRVTVRNASPIVVAAHDLFYVEGKPACDIFDDNKNLIGHVDINITLTCFGAVSKEDVVKDYRCIINQQITSQITL